MIPKTILVQGVIIALLALCLYTTNASLRHCRMHLNYQYQKDDQSRARLRQLETENAELRAANKVLWNELKSFLDDRQHFRDSRWDGTP